MLVIQVLLWNTTDGQLRKFSFTREKMGSPFTIIIYAKDSASVTRVVNQAFDLTDSLVNIYSDYFPNSELNRLCNEAGSGRWNQVSAPLFEILQKAKDAGKISNGTFDITVSPIVRLWRTARREKKLPQQDSLDVAKKRVGYEHIKLDPGMRSVNLVLPGMQLDLGGIAKGDIAQRIQQYLASSGLEASMVDAGGDIMAGKAPPGKQGWTIGINQPDTETLMAENIVLENMAVATSGDLYQFLELNGKRYSHLVDPRTGCPDSSSRNVTVIAPAGADADWLTKACSILPVKKALRLINRLKNTEVQIAVLEDEIPKYFRSKHFQQYFLNQAAPE